VHLEILAFIILPSPWIHQSRIDLGVYLVVEY
jgi:hypothetical protein